LCRQQIQIWIFVAYACATYDSKHVSFLLNTKTSLQRQYLCTIWLGEKQASLPVTMAHCRCINQVTTSGNMTQQQSTSTTFNVFPEKATHYQVLQISPTASNEEIKRAFHTLARTHHPDRNTANNNCTNNRSIEFQRIQTAWKELRDNRAHYDQALWLQHTKRTHQTTSATALAVDDCVEHVCEDGVVFLYTCRCGTLLDTSLLVANIDDDDDYLMECSGCSLVYDTSRLWSA
jgi:hypothetical protein